MAEMTWTNIAQGFADLLGALADAIPQHLERPVRLSPLSLQSGGREPAELVEDGCSVFGAPFLGDLPVRETEYVDRVPAHPAPGRRDAHKRPQMRTFDRQANGDLISVRHDVLLGGDD